MQLKQKSGHKEQPSLTLMVLPHFDLICDLLCYSFTPKWNLFALSYEKQNVVNGEVLYGSVLQQIISTNQLKQVYNPAYPTMIYAPFFHGLSMCQFIYF